MRPLLFALSLAGCGAVQGANPPLLPLATLVQEAGLADQVGRRVRFYAVLHDFYAVPTPRDGGRRMVAMTLYGVRLEGDPPIPAGCDFGVRTGGVAALVPAEVAAPWAGRSPNTIFLMTARVERWWPGEPRWSPTPLSLEVDSLTAMDTCPRSDQGGPGGPLTRLPRR